MSRTRLEEMVAEAIVDCHDQEEQATGFFTMIEDNLELPFETTILGDRATVLALHLTAAGDIVAVCRRGRHRQAIPLLGLRLPAPPPSGWEWIEAYRHWLRAGR